MMCHLITSLKSTLTVVESEGMGATSLVKRWGGLGSHSLSQHHAGNLNWLFGPRGVSALKHSAPL